MPHKIPSILLASLLFVGCAPGGSGGSAGASVRSKASVDSSAGAAIIPSEIIGMDANKNGIRDDVDDFLRRQKLPPNKMAAAESYAAALQLKVATKFADKEQFSAFYMTHITPTLDRLMGIPGGYKIFKDIERATLNTDARMSKVLQDDALMNGEMISLGDDLP